MEPDQSKPYRGIRWYVWEKHLLDMLATWRFTRDWRDEMMRQGISIDANYFYNPTGLILDMLGIPPESDDFHRAKYETMLARFRGTNITHLRALFAAILRDVFDV